MRRRHIAIFPGKPSAIPDPDDVVIIIGVVRSAADEDGDMSGRPDGKVVSGADRAGRCSVGGDERHFQLTSTRYLSSNSPPHSGPG